MAHHAEEEAALNAKSKAPRTLWIMLPILLGQMFLLSYRLADQSMWTDEMFSASLTYHATPGEVLDQVRRTERRPPLQFISIWGWSRVAGRSDLSLRYLSVMCALATTALAFKLGKLLLSEDTGLWAALLTATAPTLLLYGRMTRGYAMTMALGLASTLSFWHAWCRQRPKDWGVYLLCTALLLTSDYPALAIVAAHLLFALTQWKDVRRHQRHLLLPAVGLCVTLGAFWTILKWQASPANMMGYSEPLGFIPEFQPAPYAKRLLKAAVGGVYMLYSFAFGETVFPWSPIIWAGGVAVIAWMWQASRQLCRHPARNVAFAALTFLAAFALFCLVACGFILGQNQLVVAAARGLFIAPYFYLVLALGSHAVAGRRATVCAAIVLLSVRAVAVLNLVADPTTLFNPVYGVPVREIAAQVARNVQPGDAVVFEEPLPFDLYFRQLDDDTPLFTPGPHHIGHSMGTDVLPGSPAFLGQGEPFIPAIEPKRLLAYLEENPPSRLWLILFQHEGTERNLESEVGQPLVQDGLYRMVSRMGYAPQDPLYARLRARLRPRTPIEYKAEVLLYLPQE